MLKISLKSSRKPLQVLDEARRFFKRHGLKPKMTESNSAWFESQRGYVSIEVTHQSEVTLETENLEALVKHFAEQIK